MIALCVGHSRPGDSGAESVGGVSEHAFNSRIAAKVASTLTASGMACTVVTAYQGSGYTSAMKWLAEKLRTCKATVALELHFNASDNAAASGHEWLHWHASSQGRALATAIEARMVQAFPMLPRRGVKGIGSKDRGGEFARLTPCPAVLCEPFFGSNKSDWQLISTHQDRYAKVLADALCDWKGGA